MSFPVRAFGRYRRSNAYPPFNGLGASGRANSRASNRSMSTLVRGVDERLSTNEVSFDRDARRSGELILRDVVRGRGVEQRPRRHREVQLPGQQVDPVVEDESRRVRSNRLRLVRPIATPEGETNKIVLLRHQDGREPAESVSDALDAAGLRVAGEVRVVAVKLCRLLRGEAPTACARERVKLLVSSDSARVRTSVSEVALARPGYCRPST